jgi:hypothetical protein
MVTWKSREHLEQQALDLDVGLVDLVDQQHGRIVSADRAEQRTGEQELLGEDVVVGLAPRVPAATGLDPEQLLLVVPLVERARLVEALVALQPDQLGSRRARHRLGQLSLADAGRTLDQQRLLQRPREVRRQCGRIVGEVAGRAQPCGRVVGGLEPGRHGVDPSRGSDPPFWCRRHWRGALAGAHALPFKTSLLSPPQSGGLSREGGIRTRGRSPYDRFQGGSDRPLRHLSSCSAEAPHTARLYRGKIAG